MRQVIFAAQFKRDYKKRRREKGVDELLQCVLDQLSVGAVLATKFRDHSLKGNYLGSRECHLKPDLLLIYIITDEQIRLVRLGSHSELFD